MVAAVTVFKLNILQLQVVTSNSGDHSNCQGRAPVGSPADRYPDRLGQRICSSQGASRGLPQVVSFQSCIEQDAGWLLTTAFTPVVLRKLAGREVSAPGMNW